MSKRSPSKSLSRVDLANVALARQCLVLIRDIAERGALSWDPEQVGYALEELSQVLLERTGCDDRIFEPVSATETHGLRQLYDELVFVDAGSQDMNRPERCQ